LLRHTAYSAGRQYLHSGKQLISWYGRSIHQPVYFKPKKSFNIIDAGNARDRGMAD
jgi:hypothetical protein